MKPTVYIETTIPSYLVARPSKLPRLQADQDTAVVESACRRLRYVCVGHCHPRSAAWRLYDGRRAFGQDPKTSRACFERYRKNLAVLLLERVIPARAIDDAAHIAVAAVNGMDFLLTWNCRHINNRYTIRRIEKCCADAGFACPVVATPAELMSIEK